MTVKELIHYVLEMAILLLIIIEAFYLIPSAMRSEAFMQQHQGALLMAALLRDDYKDGYSIEPLPTPRPTLEPVNVDRLPVTPMPREVDHGDE